jgi:hypothetical protein
VGRAPMLPPVVWVGGWWPWHGRLARCPPPLHRLRRLPCPCICSGCTAPLAVPACALPHLSRPSLALQLEPPTPPPPCPPPPPSSRSPARAHAACT